MRKKRTKAEKELLLSLYFSEKRSKTGFEKYHDFPRGWVKENLCIFGVEDKPEYVSIMPDHPIELEKLSAPSPGEDELRKKISDLQAEVCELKHALRASNLTRDAYDCMITEAEKKYVIPIRKNSDAK